MVIDAHHHFWKYTPREYGWIDDGMAVIRRDFLPADLRRATAEAAVEGVVSVQARQTVEETAWLLDLADQHDFIRGVVGWVPLTSPTIEENLARFVGPKLKGVRHVLQGEPDEYMASPEFNRGLAELQNYGLVYDILIVERQLPAAIELFDHHPHQTIVLDHIAKPRIRDNVISPWCQNIRELARRPNVFCKLSGMVTEADYHAWTAEQLKPYVDTVLESFGPNRVMLGSDWPVCLVACGYHRWINIVRDFLADYFRSGPPGAPGRMPTDEEREVLGGTAIRAYGL